MEHSTQPPVRLEDVPAFLDRVRGRVPCELQVSCQVSARGYEIIGKARGKWNPDTFTPSAALLAEDFPGLLVRRAAGELPDGCTVDIFLQPLAADGTPDPDQPARRYAVPAAAFPA